MLSLVNKYGLSHVCADPEFENIEYSWDQKGDRDFAYEINFPYLDMHLKPGIIYREWPEILAGINIEYFLRGTKDKVWEFQNLFEYLLWTSLHGAGQIYSYNLKKKRNSERVYKTLCSS